MSRHVKDCFLARGISIALLPTNNALPCRINPKIIRIKMKTHLDVFCLGLVRDVIGYPKDEIEIGSGMTVGEILRIPPEIHSAPFEPSLCKESGNLRSMTCFV